jgi:hypothetical protein
MTSITSPSSATSTSTSTGENVNLRNCLSHPTRPTGGRFYVSNVQVDQSKLRMTRKWAKKRCVIRRNATPDRRQPC